MRTSQAQGHERGNRERLAFLVPAKRVAIRHNYTITRLAARFGGEFGGLV